MLLLERDFEALAEKFLLQRTSQIFLSPFFLFFFFFFVLLNKVNFFKAPTKAEKKFGQIQSCNHWNL